MGGNFVRYPVLHAGLTSDGRIVTSHGHGNACFIDDGASGDEMRARAARALEHGTSGGPWVPVPGKAEHQVIGELANSKTITAEMAGWVFNDAALVDSVCGAGTYERVMPSEEVAILQLARPLYATVVFPDSGLY